MKQKFIMIGLLCMVQSQAQVTFIVDSLPSYTPPGDYLYIAGDFTAWQPGSIDYRMEKNAEQKWEITLAAAAEGTEIQYKFTRGSWETVEKGPNGEEISNRLFTYGNGDTVRVIIFNWRQDGGGGGSTAAENVILMDDDFNMPQLGRTRGIWLYLPPDYETSGKSYPVMYMHDGQNLFDDQASFAGEWHVDETLNSLHGEGMMAPIVVGIENGGIDRIAEYTPWRNPSYGGGDGELYMDFIVSTLKPFIDQNYRTLPARESTGIMGSSLGGLISHYGSLKYQDVFSKAGVFSPSYWFSDSVWAFTAENGKAYDMRIYQMCGGAEGEGVVEDMMNMQDLLISLGFSENEISSKVIPAGQHNEALWSQEFGEAYQWLFASYANNIDEQTGSSIIRLFPNPADDILTLPAEFPDRCDSLEVIDMQGNVVKKSVPFEGKNLDVSQLAPGIYLVSLIVNGNYYQGKIMIE